VGEAAKRISEGLKQRHPHTLVRVLLGPLMPRNLGDLLVFVCVRDAHDAT
jgi:hypothetical protein